MMKCDTFKGWARAVSVIFQKEEVSIFHGIKKGHPPVTRFPVWPVRMQSKVFRAGFNVLLQKSIIVGLINILWFHVNINIEISST